MMEGALLNVIQVSEILGIKPSTIYNWKCLHRGNPLKDIPSVKIGARLMFKKQDVEAFIERCQEGAGNESC